MKKLFTVFGAIALITVCTNARAVDVFGAECEQIAVGPRGDILVKCPVTDTLREIQSGTPTAKFLSVNCDMIDCDAVVADNESIYVNVDQDSCGPNTTGYGIMVQNANMNEMYAVYQCVDPNSTEE